MRTLLVGDVHGCLDELDRLLDGIQPGPADTVCLLGDYIDRGQFSYNGILRTVLQLQVSMPEHVYLLRGNHESRQITQVYGFYDECCRKYGS